MKKNIFKYILLLAMVAIAAFGCNKFDEINTNPNQTTTVSSAQLATNMILSITRGTISSQKTFMQPSLFAKYITWGEGQESLQYNNIGRVGFGRISLLRNIGAMISYAPTEQLKSSYQALGHFIKAWQYFYTTMQVGDIPFSEAVKGESESIIKPKYDAQKTVFLGILSHLDSANMLFAVGADFGGDPIYSGSVDKWRRLSNSFQLYVLMTLNKKTGDADLKVGERFKEIVANRPLMRDYKDNFALAFNATAGQNYPWSNVPDGTNPNIKSKYAMLAVTLIEPLKAMQDKRLFYYAKPSPVQIAAGKKASDYSAYIGVEPSNSFSSLQIVRTGGDYSDFNNRYILEVASEPVNLYSYAEQQFIMAEAAVRGWVTGKAAQEYYADGIKSSMNFIVAYTKDLEDYNHGMKMDENYINAFPATAAVALTGNAENQISQIITQKYLANFLHGHNYTSWYENRRTGYPVFKLNSSTNLNTPSTQFPKKWLYPSDELSYNTDNVNAAIASQFGGNDNVNAEMWLLK